MTCLNLRNRFWESLKILAQVLHKWSTNQTMTRSKDTEVSWISEHVILVECSRYFQFLAHWTAAFHKPSKSGTEWRDELPTDDVIGKPLIKEPCILLSPNCSNCTFKM